MEQDWVEIRTPDNVGIDYTPAGLGTRMCALMLDGLVLGAIVLVLAVVVDAAIASTTEPRSGTLTVLALVGVLTLGYLAYFTVLELAMSGQTVGKRAMGLRVIRTDGSAAAVPDILVRNVLRLVDSLFLVGAVLLFAHPRSRRLGDLAAGTMVVRERRPRSLAPLAAAPPAPLVLRTPDAGPPIDGLGHLGQHEHGVLRAFLGRPGLHPEQRAQLAAGMAGRLWERMQLPQGAPERRWQPELFLERLYLQLGERLDRR